MNNKKQTGQNYEKEKQNHLDDKQETNKVVEYFTHPVFDYGEIYGMVESDPDN